MIDIKYANAFSEVLEILKYIPKNEYEKIPFEMIEVFEDNSNIDYIVEYNPNIDLSNQNISKEARTIIAILFRDYWATKIQQSKILKKEKSDLYISEETKKEKYNYETLFKTNNIEKEQEQKQENKLQETSLIEYKENFFERFKKFLLKLFSIH